MKRFLAPAAAINSAAQPACLSSDEHDMGAGSAAQTTPQLQSMADAQGWLTTQCASADNPDVQQLRQAVSILNCSKLRMKIHGTKPRPLAHFIEELSAF